jgi:hypothetical protein
MAASRRATAAFVQTTQSEPVGWYDLQIGGGGNVIGIDINPTDGTFLAWIDVGGLWLSNTSGGTWTQLVNATSMPSPQLTAQHFTGVYYAKSAPSNSSTMYMLWGGDFSGVYVSTNKGASWRQITAITSSVPSPNAQTDSSWGQKIIINPSNDAEAYIGVPNGGGLWHVRSYTSATRLDPGTIPSASSGYGYYGMVWQSSTIIIPVYGTGVYISSNSGSSWASSSGAPREIYSGSIGTDRYYCLDSPSGLPYRLLSGTWSAIGASLQVRFASIAANPFNAAEVAINENAGYILLSANANTGSPTWPARGSTITVASPDVPWMAWSFIGGAGNPGYLYLDSSMIAFDNSVSGKIWTGCGIGTFYNTTGDGTYWTDMSAGQETVVATWICWPPGGPPIVSLWDRTAFCIQSRYASERIRS